MNANATSVEAASVNPCCENPCGYEAGAHPQVGQRLELTKPYTSPTGTWLPARTELRVALVGPGSTMLRAVGCGTVVWMDTHGRWLAGE